jgi:hypothetical protein
LAIEPFQLNDDSEKTPACEVEDNHVILPNPVEKVVGAESDSPRLGKANTGIENQNANEFPGDRLVLPNRRGRVRIGEGPPARDDEVAARCNGKVERAQGGILDEAGGAQSSRPVKDNNRVVTLPRWSDAGGKIKSTITREPKSPREGDDVVRKHGRPGRASEAGRVSTVLRFRSVR